RVLELHALARGDLRAHVDLLPDAEQVGVVAELGVELDQVGAADPVAPGDLAEVLAGHDLVGVQGGPVVAGLAVLGPLGLDADLDRLADPQRVGVLLELGVAGLDRLDADVVLGRDPAEGLALADLVLGDRLAAAARLARATRRAARLARGARAARLARRARLARAARQADLELLALADLVGIEAGVGSLDRLLADAVLDGDAAEGLARGDLVLD